MRARTEPWMLVLMILVGAVIGSLLWSLVTPYLPEIFAKSITVGTTGAPLNLDLGVVSFTLGLVLLWRKKDIKAALFPDDTDYYFFRHDKYGKIYMAKTQLEHDENGNKVLRANSN